MRNRYTYARAKYVYMWHGSNPWHTTKITVMKCYSYLDLSIAREMIGAWSDGSDIAKQWISWRNSVLNMFDILYKVVNHLKTVQKYGHRDAIARAWWLVKNSGKNSYQGIMRYLYKRESAREFCFDHNMYYGRERRIYDPITGQCVTTAFIRKGRSKSGKHALKMRRARLTDRMQSNLGL